MSTILARNREPRKMIQNRIGYFDMLPNSRVTGKGDDLSKANPDVRIEGRLTWFPADVSFFCLLGLDELGPNRFADDRLLVADQVVN